MCISKSITLKTIRSDIEQTVLRRKCESCGYFWIEYIIQTSKGEKSIVDHNFRNISKHLRNSILTGPTNIILQRMRQKMVNTAIHKLSGITLDEEEIDSEDDYENTSEDAYEEDNEDADSNVESPYYTFPQPITITYRSNLTPILPPWHIAQNTSTTSGTNFDNDETE